MHSLRLQSLAARFIYHAVISAASFLLLPVLGSRQCPLSPQRACCVLAVDPGMGEPRWQLCGRDGAAFFLLGRGHGRTRRNSKLPTSCYRSASHSALGNLDNGQAKWCMPVPKFPSMAAQYNGKASLCCVYCTCSPDCVTLGNGESSQQVLGLSSYHNPGRGKTAGASATMRNRIGGTATVLCTPYRVIV